MHEIYKILLDETGLKSADVARATGISNMTLSDWKRGKSVPKSDKMRKIAEYLNVSVDYLMTGKDGAFTKEIAETDAKLLFMNKEIKEYALKLNNLPKEKQKIIMDLIDQIS